MALGFEKYFISVLKNSRNKLQEYAMKNGSYRLKKFEVFLSLILITPRLNQYDIILCPFEVIQFLSDIFFHSSSRDFQKLTL